MTGRVLRRRESVVQREVAGETFLVPIRGHVAQFQELFVLNEVGSWLWERLDGHKRLDDLVTSVVAEYEVEPGQAEEDIRLFVQQLAEAGLAEEISAPRD